MNLKIIHTGLKAFLFYIPLFFTVVFVYGKKKRGYSFCRGDISDLLKQVWGAQDDLLRVLFVILALLSFFLVLGMGCILSPTLLSKATLLLISLSLFSLIAVPFLPENKMGKQHFNNAKILFSSCMAASALLIPLTLSSLIPNRLILLNLLIITMGFAFVLAEFKKMGVIKKSGPFWKKLLNFRGACEWIFAATTLLWTFIAGIFILNQIRLLI